MSERVILEVGQGGKEKGGPSLGVQGKGVCSSTASARDSLSQHCLGSGCHPSRVFLPQGPALGAQAKP